MVYINEKKILEAFMEEVRELLDTLNQKLLELEEFPEDPDVINEIFRLTHSIKSETALVGYKNMAMLAHKMEDIFEKVRRGDLIVDKEIMDALFDAFDRVMVLINMAQNGEDEEGADISDVVNPLFKILNEEVPEGDTPSKTETDASGDGGIGALKVKYEKVNAVEGIEFSDIEKNDIEDGVARGETFYRLVFELEADCDMRYPRAYLVYNNFENSGTVIRTIPDILNETNDEKFAKVTIFLLTTADQEALKSCADVDQVETLLIQEISEKGVNEHIDAHDSLALDEKEILKAEEIEKQWAEQMMKEQEEEKAAPDTKEVKKEVKKEARVVTEKIAQKQTIRVDIERLDELLNLVGELIINRSRFMQITDDVNEVVQLQDLKTELEDATNELERISDQMQMKMMQARMVPVGNVFSKFPRLVRDLANSLHKNIHLEIIGENTEIDRTVIELLADPLTHLIRNSIDHGIEMPDERERLGKNREGRILLRAYQEGSNIYIEVSDDGKGIDVEAIKNKAIENGLVSAAQVSSLPTNEILNFIFEPGFSTKKEISNVSGRGVGMDVVKTQLEKLRGRIDTATKIGEGSKFTIVLPLTTTIVEALLVNVEKNIFAIPISVVEETIKISMSEIRDFDDYQIYNLRNETLAVIHLSDLVGMHKHKEDEENVFIVVISFERRRIGLVVNDLMGEQDIVIKGLDDVLKNSEGVAGAAVLGDGRIALILDTSTLVKSALKEINKLAKEYDVYNDAEGVTLSSLYDSLNKEERMSNNNAHTPQQKTMTANDNKVDMQQKTSSTQANNAKPDAMLSTINEIFDDIKNN